MEPRQHMCGGKSNRSTTIREDNIENNLRGIRNVSRVSCHVACAIQILCHAIPAVRSTLNRLVFVDETSEYIHILDGSQSSPPVLLEELLDFVRVTKSCKRGGNETNQDDNCNEINSKERPFSPSKPWNPQRLYSCLEGRSSSALAIDPHNVGDATRSLSCLLRLLSQEGACCGPVWKRLLDVSIWEGETRQILEGHRPLDRDDGSTIATVTPSRVLQRIKPAAKNKPMLSPLVLKFYSDHRAATNEPANGGSGESRSSSNWSVVNALSEIVKPQRIQGSSYPWESISPDTYSEQEIMCRSNQNCDDYIGKIGDKQTNSRDNDIDIDSSSSSSSSSSSDDENECDAYSDSSLSSSSRNDLNDVNWVTSKRLEIRRIPRVWLLHLDRPRVSVNKIRRSFPLEYHRGLFDHVNVPLELNASSIMTTIATSTKDGNGGSNSEVTGSHKRHDAENYDKNSGEFSSMGLFLRGAIVQVVELDICDDDSKENEEDWEGGHSITLLRKSNSDEPLSWMLIDDDNTQPISEKRAIRMIGGVLEANDCARDNSNESDVTHGWTYFAASLLVYSIPGDGSWFDDSEKWKPFQDDIVSSWKEHRTQLAATIASQEAFVGKRIRVKWTKEKFYSGTVTRYDLSTGKHQVTYDDGDIRDYNLSKKTIEWIV